MGIYQLGLKFHSSVGPVIYIDTGIHVTYK
jgi:hypothetical protein